MAASATSQPSVSTPHTSGTPHLASPRLTSPHRASPRKHHLASPRLTSQASPRLTSLLRRQACRPLSQTCRPQVTLTWKSGKKLALGGVGRQLPEGSDGSGERGARWETPVSLKCSIYKKGAQTEPRLSELVVKIEGVRTPRKLTGTVDLAAHASYERTSSKLVVPLSHGAGYLKLTLSSAWAEMGGDGYDDAASSTAGSELTDASERRHPSFSPLRTGARHRRPTPCRLPARTPPAPRPASHALLSTRQARSQARPPLLRRRRRERGQGQGRRTVGRHRTAAPAAAAAALPRPRTVAGQARPRRAVSAPRSAASPLPPAGERTGQASAAAEVRIRVRSEPRGPMGTILRSAPNRSTARVSTAPRGCKTAPRRRPAPRPMRTATLRSRWGLAHSSALL